ncbi:MAG: hypothetical protein HUU25_08290 [Candidatus Sumerlaeia bacterium]|nr:hypothetical protein [Candidatus Sumerlaeia bacterium]
METVNPQDLVATLGSGGYPAAPWFLMLFKVLGFTLHAVPMNLWYAGVLLAMLLQAFGGEQARRWSARLLRQMPVIIAFGVNLGIVPLLFTQVTHYRVFYPATILIAWPWLSIIALLILAYYGAYWVAHGLRGGETQLRGARVLAGWLVAALFIAIGFVFANGFSLMTNLQDWPAIWQRTQVAGAVTGVAMNSGDPTLLPRFLMFFSLAFTTVAVHMVFDAGALARRESEVYRQSAARLALPVHVAGLAGFAVFGSWYIFGVMPETSRSALLAFPGVIFAVSTALAPGAVAVALFTLRGRPVSFGAGVAVAAMQVLVLGLNAISRQIAQSAELAPHLDITAEPVRWQWSPMVLFLVLFVAGLGVIAWLVRRAVLESRAMESQSNGSPGRG